MFPFLIQPSSPENPASAGFQQRGLEMQAFAADGTKPTRAYGLNDDFSPTLQQLMIHFSGTAQQSSERIANIQGELDEARHVMVNNIESVLERGEKIELLVDKTESLNHQAFRFAKGARSLRREMWLQNLKMVLCVLFVVGLAALFISMMACGADFAKCRHDPPPPPPHPFLPPPRPVVPPPSPSLPPPLPSSPP